MKTFYELYRDTENKIVVSSRTDYSFPPHFHGSVEIFILLNGRYKISMDNKTYVAEGKSVIVSDSFCIHAFQKLTDTPSDSMLIIIPSTYLLDYKTIKESKMLKDSICTDESFVDEICFLTKYLLKHDDNEYIKQKYSNLILSLFIEKVGLVETHKKLGTTTIKNILTYIEENFRENITLESISQYFGYSSCHLSRMFHSFFKMSISQYINEMRIRYIDMKKGSCDKLLSLIYESGFKSPQTYYRNLKRYKLQN